MLKLNASFQKKVPVPGQEFSSQSYHAAVEIEIPDGVTGEDLQSRIRDTFALVRDSVERELGPQASAAPPADIQDTVPASERQLGYLHDLAIRAGMTPAELTADLRRTYGVRRLYDLTRRQASAAIDRFSAGTPPGRSAA